MASFTAFLDASVLYPAPLRDLLLELAVSDLYRAKWSNAVHDEWINAVLRSRTDLTRERLERTRDLMNAHVRDALVADFEDLIEILELPDPGHRLELDGELFRIVKEPASQATPPPYILRMYE